MWSNIMQNDSKDVINNKELQPVGENTRPGGVKRKFHQTNENNAVSNNGVKGGRFKTIICKFWQTSGNCHYGDKCSYAHGSQELGPGAPNGIANTQHNKSASEIHSLRSNFRQISQRSMKIAGNFKPNEQNPNAMNSYMQQPNPQQMQQPNPPQMQQPNAPQMQQPNAPQMQQPNQQIQQNNMPPPQKNSFNQNQQKAPTAMRVNPLNQQQNPYPSQIQHQVPVNQPPAYNQIQQQSTTMPGNKQPQPPVYNQNHIPGGPGNQPQQQFVNMVQPVQQNWLQQGQQQMPNFAQPIQQNWNQFVPTNQHMMNPYGQMVTMQQPMMQTPVVQKPSVNSLQQWPPLPPSPQVQQMNLQATLAAALVGSSSMNSFNHGSARPDLRFKTMLCRHFANKGYCTKEVQCKFAHGEDELRTYAQNSSDANSGNSRVTPLNNIRREALANWKPKPRVTPLVKPQQTVNTLRKKSTNTNQYMRSHTDNYNVALPPSDLSLHTQPPPPENSDSTDTNIDIMIKNQMNQVNENQQETNPEANSFQNVYDDNSQSQEPPRKRSRFD